MQNHRLVPHSSSLNKNGQFCRNTFLLKSIQQSQTFRATICCPLKQLGLDQFVQSWHVFRSLKVKCVTDVNIEEIFDEDDELCPVECVKEFYTDDEFLKVLEKSKETKSLVVVDFYRTACGSCKYVEQIFTKLCKGSGNEEAEVIFLKHNVIDEYDEQSEVAERLRIKVVPLFHFYKDGELVEAFPTRDKEKIIAAIHKYTTSVSRDY